mmetsp:Transcript_27841/g.71610  ORF Transcript_27841/g.71610 Transcript_27841/m.71610 type:complete len:95 (+) Transcript_27841:38-322(+)
MAVVKSAEENLKQMEEDLKKQQADVEFAQRTLNLAQKQVQPPQATQEHMQEYMSKKAVAEAKVMESIEQASKAQALAQEARGKMAAQKRTVDSS